VILRESRFDPVYELPVKKLREITLSEKKSIQTAEIHSTVPSDALLPFVHQRYDDLSPVGEE
jgi:acetoacetate decarboxylase